jgi:hypothetical protein
MKPRTLFLRPRLSAFSFQVVFATLALLVSGASILPRVWANSGLHGIETSEGVEWFRIRETGASPGLSEQVYEHREERWIGSDTFHAVLFSRDLDGDRKPDAWFYRSESGVLQSLDRPAATSHGWDVASQILEEQLLDQGAGKDRWIAGVAFNAVLGQLSFTIAHSQALEQSVLADEINIQSLQLLAHRISRKDPRDPSIRVLQGIASRGLDDLIQRLETQEARRLAGGLVADAALLFLTGGLGRGLVAAERWAVARIGGTTAGRAAAAAFERYTLALRSSLGRLGGRTATQALAHAEAQMLARLAPPEAMRVALRGWTSRSQVARLAGQGLQRVADVVKAGASQWRYILLTQSLQVGAELLSRGRELYDPNPIIMAQKFASNEEFIQNFLYMSNETFWMAGLSTYFQRPASRVIACGILSLVDSTIMNYAIKRTMDPERQALDTGWEVVIGNAQTQIDLAALRASQAAATRSGNPRLKLLGYAVVVLDQGSGYYAYSEASQALNDRRNTVETHLVPVMGPP